MIFCLDHFFFYYHSTKYNP